MSVQYYKRFRMQLVLKGLAIELRALPRGYSFLSWNVDDVDIHADVKYRSFRWELDSSVFPCLGDGLGCQQLMADIARRDGFLPSATWLVAADSLGLRPTPYSRMSIGADRFDLADQIESIGEPDYCGTIQGVISEHGIGSIQNVGVTPDHRGRGLGAALVLQAAQGFQLAGLDRVQLEVTARNKDAIRLYRRLGFRTVKTVYKAVEIAYT